MPSFQKENKIAIWHIFINMHFLYIVVAFIAYKTSYINENYSCLTQDKHDAVVFESIPDIYVVCY